MAGKKVPKRKTRNSSNEGNENSSVNDNDDQAKMADAIEDPPPVKKQKGGKAAVSGGKGKRKSKKLLAKTCRQSVNAVSFQEDGNQVNMEVGGGESEELDYSDVEYRQQEEAASCSNNNAIAVAEQNSVQQEETRSRRGKFESQKGKGVPVKKGGRARSSSLKNGCNNHDREQTSIRDQGPGTSGVAATRERCRRNSQDSVQQGQGHEPDRSRRADDEGELEDSRFDSADESQDDSQEDSQDESQLDSSEQGDSQYEDTEEDSDPPPLLDTTTGSVSDEQPEEEEVQFNTPSRNASKGRATKGKRKTEQSDDEIATLREELDNVNKSFRKLQEMMEKGQYAEKNLDDKDGDGRGRDRRRRSRESGRRRDREQDDRPQGTHLNTRDEIESVTTIYKQAVQPKRTSSSSEDMINTSDETAHDSSGDRDHLDIMVNKFRGANLSHLLPGNDRARQGDYQDRDGYRDNERRRERS